MILAFLDWLLGLFGLGRQARYRKALTPVRERLARNAEIDTEIAKAAKARIAKSQTAITKIKAETDDEALAQLEARNREAEKK